MNDGRDPGEGAVPQRNRRVMTDLLFIELEEAAQKWERAANGPSADAEHDAGRELAELAQAAYDAYQFVPAPVTVSDAAALGALVRAAWEHQLVAWVDATVPAGFTWGTVRGIGDGHGNPGDDSADIRECFLRVTSSTGRDLYLPVVDAVEHAKAGVLVTNYNQHPEAHGPGVWCGRCPDMTPPDPAVFRRPSVTPVTGEEQ